VPVLDPLAEPVDDDPVAEPLDPSAGVLVTLPAEPDPAPAACVEPVEAEVELEADPAGAGSVLLTEVGLTTGAPGALVAVEVEPPAVEVPGVEAWLALLLAGTDLPARAPAAAGTLAGAGGGAGASAGWNTGAAGTAALTYAGTTGTTGVT
jgi:hypothetical protein